MIILILCLNLLNLIGLIIAFLIYFNKNYTICAKDVYTELQNYWLEYHDEEGNELGRELAGGVGTDTGFFREALYEEEEPDDE